MSSYYIDSLAARGVDTGSELMMEKTSGPAAAAAAAGMATAAAASIPFERETVPVCVRDCARVDGGRRALAAAAQSKDGRETIDCPPSSEDISSSG